GVAAAVVALRGIAWRLKDEPVPGAGAAPPRIAAGTPPGTHRVLVVAPPGTESVALRDRATEVVVVVPALASRVEAVTGAVDDRRAEAEHTAATLAASLPNARGEVGADDPALAVDDALRLFGADEILVVGDDDLVTRVRSRVTIPVRRA